MAINKSNSLNFNRGRNTSDEVLMPILYNHNDNSNTYGSGIIRVEVPMNIFHPEVYGDDVFQSFCAVALGQSQSEQYLNIIAVEIFIPSYSGDVYSGSLTDIIYVNYGDIEIQMNQSQDFHGYTIKIPCVLPPDAQFRIRVLVNKFTYINQGIFSNYGPDNIVVGTVYSQWETVPNFEGVENDIVDISGVSRVPNLLAGVNYGGGYDHNYTNVEASGLSNSMYGIPDELGFDHSKVENSLERLYSGHEGTSFGVEAYPYISQTYLDMFRYRIGDETRWARPSRCIETARVWIGVPYLHPRFALRLSGIPQYENKTYTIQELQELSESNTSGIRIGKTAIIQREFSNPLGGRLGPDESVLYDPNSDEEMGNMQPWNPLSDDLGDLNDLGDMVTNYNQFSSIGSIQGILDNYLDIDTQFGGYNTNLLDEFGEDLGILDAQGAFSNPYFDLQTNPSSQANAQFYWNGSSWESFDVNYSAWQDLVQNQWTSITGSGIDAELNVDFEYIPTGAYFNSNVGVPLNRNLNTYESVQDFNEDEITEQARGIHNGIWTYIDFDIDTRLLPDGVYNFGAKFGYLDPNDGSFVLGFNQTEDEYKTVPIMVSNDQPYIHWSNDELSNDEWSFSDYSHIDYNQNLNDEYFPVSQHVINHFANNSFDGEINLADYINGIDGIRTDLNWRIKFGVRSSGGVIAKRSEVGDLGERYRLGYYPTEELEKYLDDTLNMKVGDVLTEFNGYEQRVSFSRGFVFNNYILHNPETLIKVKDVAGNTNFALFSTDTVEISPNASLKPAGIASLPEDNCMGNFGDGLEFFDSGFPGNYYKNNGFMYDTYCTEENGSCCTPHLKDFIWRSPSFKRISTGHETIYTCGLDDEQLRDYLYFFNNYIATTYGYADTGQTSSFPNENSQVWDSYFEGHDLSNAQPVLPDGTFNPWATGDYIFMGLDVFPEGAIPPNFEPPNGMNCETNWVAHHWYTYGSCQHNKAMPLNTSNDCRENCSPDKTMALDENRKFNLQLGETLTWETPNGPVESSPNPNFLGQYPCTTCFESNASSLSNIDVYQAPCGSAYGLTGKASVTINFNDLYTNDFKTITSTSSYRMESLSYIDETHTITFIDENGSQVGEKIGGCQIATTYPYSMGVWKTINLVDFLNDNGYESENPDFIKGMIIENCGNQMIMCQTILLQGHFTDGYNTSTSDIIVDWNGDEAISGCQEIGASNYNPGAVYGCDDCCTYPASVNYRVIPTTAGSPTGKEDNEMYTFTADLNRWDKISSESQNFGAISTSKGDIIFSSYKEDALDANSELKIFQGNNNLSISKRWTWVSKKLNFGYDGVYKIIKNLKIHFSRKSSDSNIPDNDISQISLIYVIDGNFPWTPINSEQVGKWEDGKTLVFKIPKEHKKCKNVQILLSSDNPDFSVESVSFVYRMKSVR